MEGLDAGLAGFAGFFSAAFAGAFLAGTGAAFLAGAFFSAGLAAEAAGTALGALAVDLAAGAAFLAAAGADGLAAVFLAGAAFGAGLEALAAGLAATFSLVSEAFLLAEVFLGEEEDGSPDLDIS
ncbi:hypothetical protein HMPREF3038_00584 [Akkermansia sp. KLE1797]|nr:hypothetical protein HMPREF3038_00584 [Akkermansia sp. KLE1797]KXU54332.1 hypothetical protein HMPREF3039_01661 [Akkermansia sp. KLE1798]KZA04686.1 hypothetical protein HMPREF1326_01741 [Akkermansia sp. KLE1605]